MRVGTIFLYLLHPYSNRDKIMCRICPQKFSCSLAFIKFVAVRGKFYLGEQINLYSLFLHVFSDISEIQYDRSTHNAVEQS